MFLCFGIPETVVSNNGPQYKSAEFVQFAKAYDFNHTTSSPLFAQSNGQAKRTIKTLKKLLKMSKDIAIAMLIYHSTPFSWCRLSPAELLMGRRLCANIPIVKDQLIPHWWYLDEFRRNNRIFKDRQKRNYDHRHASQDLPSIPNDSDVWITSGDQPVAGKVVSRASTPQSYIVNTPTGQLRRNHQHLNQVPENYTPIAPSPYPTREPIMTRFRTGTIIHPPNRL